MSALFAWSPAGRLPDDRRLRSGAAQLRTAAEMLATGASRNRHFADTISTGVWTDSASTRVKTLVEQLGHELMTGRAALYEAADALDQAAQFIAAKRGRYNQIDARLAQLRQASGNHGVVDLITEGTHLTQEQQAIGREVQAAMAHAAAAVNACANRATRTAPGAFDTVLHFIRGIGDGVVEMAEGVASLAILAAKFSPQRMLLDPTGFVRDEISATKSAVAFGEALARDPAGVLRSVGQNIINYDDLRRDPAHWAGALIPTIALAIATDGAGAATKSVTAGERVALNPGFRRLLDEGVDVRRWEDISGNTGSPGHIVKHHINTTNIDNADFIRGYIADKSRDRPYEGIFNSEAGANRVIEDALRQHADEIQRWLNTPNMPKKEDIFFDAGDFIGLAMKKGTSDLYRVTELQLVLRTVGPEVLPEGFIVQTAFPWYYSKVRQLLKGS